MKPMTKSHRVVFSLFIVLISAAALAQSDAQKSFNELKSLTGNWEGLGHNKPIQVSFRDTAGGSAFLSEIHGEGENMVTLFHMDGSDKLLMTHYCSAGNQPRMLASASPDGKTITFNFLDATNLASPDAGHMQSVVFAMLDANHHTEEWIFIDHGKERKETFDLRRKI
jgi:hypothetical protein